ncbi:hypothetical protein [Streptomyces montanisoli]|uniref:GNAT family N-acetyltransferase n=1 Tax=Streptomyces montanisoli TaxID=2798581 RepID=A0A940RXW3_9ACTN|nr:hypothetical protein [Streptomyces montanisoli]MBP0460990.1 hypothetical protein [Streptomyces montanisoli]
MRNDNDALLVQERTADDLDACVRVLAGVHARDAYPLNWPGDPAGWLDPPALDAAWVARDPASGEVVGHVALCRATRDDLAAALWCEAEGAEPTATAVVSRLFV